MISQSSLNIGDQVRAGTFRGIIAAIASGRVAIDSGRKISWFPESKVQSLEEISLEIKAYIEQQKASSETATIKALTLKQPYAQLIASGIKAVETRSWKTLYRGPLAIHAGAKPSSTKDKFELTKLSEYFGDFLSQSELAHSGIIAIANLVDCILIDEELISHQSPIELLCGYWSPGNYAWILESVTPIEHYPRTGERKLWNFSYERTSVKFLEKPQPPKGEDAHFYHDEWELVCTIKNYSLVKKYLSHPLLTHLRATPWWSFPHSSTDAKGQILVKLSELEELSEFSCPVEFPAFSRESSEDLIALEKVEDISRPAPARKHKPHFRNEGGETYQVGSLYRYTKLVNGKEYPLCGGYRLPEVETDWYWGLSYKLKNSKGQWRDKSASVARKKLPGVRLAMKLGKPLNLILAILKS